MQNAPTVEYYELYHTLNARLNDIVLAGEEFLKENGFDAYARTTDRVKTSEDKISRVPHKTVATRAGIGWIGKNCLLVTPQYGSAIRLSSILTDAPLNFDNPINEARCGQCRKCVEECPAQALYGSLWNTGIKRDRILDFRKCYEKQMEIMERNTGIATDLCGKCFVNTRIGIFQAKRLRKTRILANVHSFFIGIHLSLILFAGKYLLSQFCPPLGLEYVN